MSEKDEKIITDNNVKVVVEKSPQNDKDEVKISVIEPDSSLAQEIIVATPKEIKKKENKILNIVMVVLNIASNIAFLFFLSEVLRGFSFAGGVLGYNFNAFRVVGIIIFVVAQITGLYLTIKFISKQNLVLKLVAVSAPFTLLLLGGAWALLNINRLNSEGELAVINFLNLSDFDPASFDFKYVVIAVAIYLAILYLVFALLLRKGRKARVEVRDVVKSDE